MHGHSATLLIAQLAAALLAPGAVRGQQTTELPPPELSAATIVDPQLQQAGHNSPAWTAHHDPWSGGLEVGVTRFVHTNAVYALIDDEVGASIRPYLGYENLKGFGVRGSLFAATASSVATFASNGSQVEIEPRALSLDIDLYRRLDLDGFDLVLGAGTQAALFAFRFADDTEDKFVTGGASLFAEGSQPLYSTRCSKWSVIGGGRVGYLVGEQTYQSVASYEDVGQTMTTGKAYLGFEYRRQLSRGDLLFQLKGETQVWRADGMPALGLDTTGFNLGAAW